MAEHSPGRLGAVAVAQQRVKPAAEQQQPTRRQAQGRSAPAPATPQGQIQGHASDHEHQTVPGPQHQHQQQQPEAGAVVAFRPEGEAEGRHHPGLRVHVEQQGVEHHRLQPPEATGQPAAPWTESGLLRQRPQRYGREAQSQRLPTQQPLH